MCDRNTSRARREDGRAAAASAILRRQKILEQRERMNRKSMRCWRARGTATAIPLHVGPKKPLLLHIGRPLAVQCQVPRRPSQIQATRRAAISLTGGAKSEVLPARQTSKNRLIY